MGRPTAIRQWFLELDRLQSSYLLLATIAAVAVAAAVLFQAGLLGRFFGALSRGIRWAIRTGFRVWERCLSWASWPLFLIAVLAILGAGAAYGSAVPGAKIVAGLVPLAMGVTACLAYMFIDLERYEVERGYKAVHSPLQGQELAVNLERYGSRVGIPLLAAASVGVIGGFALLNQGLFESVGRDWYRLGDDGGEPAYVDFLSYALLKLLGVVDVLDLARSRNFMRTTFVQPARWPASTMLAAFKMFFTLVLLQQIFASVRQGRLLAETISDFWSPHEPIRERARNALPQYGGVATGPLVASLRSVATLTHEQREQMPQVFAAIGPSAIPVLVRHLDDPHEHVRDIAAAALGRLQAVDALPAVAARASDPVAAVRQSAAESVGTLTALAASPARRSRHRVGTRGRRRWWHPRWWGKAGGAADERDPVATAVAALTSALADESSAVRAQAAEALEHVGPVAAAAREALIATLGDADETVRCRAAAALGSVAAESDEAATALTESLGEGAPSVRAAAALALANFGARAEPALPALVAMMQGRDESERAAAAEAINKLGALGDSAAAALAEGLDSADNAVRAQTAEALGEIGEGAEAAAPALVAAVEDDNDRVRAKAVEALGKIGEAAADEAVPSLVRALRDPDHWVGALAAEALGEMGESADDAVPELVRSLSHVNADIRANAAEALGKIGAGATAARPALERAAADDDAAVRADAVRALGLIGLSAPSARQVAFAALHDGAPPVRAAAVDALGRWGGAGDELVAALLPLLDDANDTVKVQVMRALPRIADAVPEVIDPLCRRLLEDDSTEVQAAAAVALGQFGRAAVAAGEPLLRAARTGEAGVRLAAVRAMALIVPPEADEAFAAGLLDASDDVRLVASAGWLKASAVADTAVAALVAALRDPLVQVRANAARALARLDAAPPEAVPRLIECTADASDELRMNAAYALRSAATGDAKDVMHHLLGDTSARVRLVAAGGLLTADPTDAAARTALADALADESPNVRRAAEELAESLRPAEGAEGQEMTSSTSGEAGGGSSETTQAPRSNFAAAGRRPESR